MKETVHTSYRYLAINRIEFSTTVTLSVPLHSEGPRVRAGVGVVSSTAAYYKPLPKSRASRPSVRPPTRKRVASPTTRDHPLVLT